MTAPDLQKLSAWLDAAVAACPGSGHAAKYAAWSEGVLAGLAAGASDGQFCQALSAASRYAPKGALAPSPQLVADAEDLLAGWNPSRWTALEAARVRLIVERAKADPESLLSALEEAFRYADEGELCALYRSLQFLPGPERFAVRSAEGCRTNMKTVFEANGMDTPFPEAHFDDVAWHQLCMKSLFVEAPLWRVVGFDRRVDEELARMALDLADERRSAGRRVFPELWMCMGSAESGLEATKRKLAAIEKELSGDDELSRKGAILALGRLGQTERLEEIQADGGTYFGPIAGWALMGRHDQTAFASISPPEGAEPQTREHEEGRAQGALLFPGDTDSDPATDTPGNPS
ncbi:EboA domain-containing protein [Planctomycetes bacterium Poly30]|uniref:EboA domain-containing protein n=1 Tax=Saltatorellus ferox TaxID=2528018 RepID=UPI0011A187E4